MPRNLVEEDDPIFQGGRRTAETPPTPQEIFRNLGLAIAGLLFMVLVVVSLASVLAH